MNDFRHVSLPFVSGQLKTEELLSKTMHPLRVTRGIVSGSHCSETRRLKLSTWSFIGSLQVSLYVR